jgi:hypothetical protein
VSSWPVLPFSLVFSRRAHRRRGRHCTQLLPGQLKRSEPSGQQGAGSLALLAGCVSAYHSAAIFGEQMSPEARHQRRVQPSIITRQRR